MPPSIDYRIFQPLSEKDGLREQVCTLAAVDPRVAWKHYGCFHDIDETQNLEKRDYV